MSALNLVCLLEGGQDVFIVTVSTDDSVIELQNRIKKVNENDLRGVDAHHLRLWKVRDSA
jgi:hypothetical protein